MIHKVGFAALALLAAAFGPACAADWPARPIRVVVPIAAGSVTDVIMRKAAEQLAPKLGQALVIDNRGGAAGVLGGGECANAQPDGYTLCVVYHSTMSFNPLLFTRLPYNADRSFDPVTRLFFLIEGLIVSKQLGVSTVAELKALAQAKPGSLNYGTLGANSFPDLFRIWLNNQWNTGIVGVSYKGGGPVALATFSNEVQMSKIGVGNFLGMAASGDIKVLAVSAPRRSTELPDVPTFEEAGLGGYPGFGWWGLMVPHGTPPAIVQRLNEVFVTLFRDKAFSAFLDKQVVVSAPTTVDEFAAFLKADRESAAALIKIANTKPVEFKE